MCVCVCVCVPGRPTLMLSACLPILLWCPTVSALAACHSAREIKGGCSGGDGSAGRSCQQRGAQSAQRKRPAWQAEPTEGGGESGPRRGERPPACSSARCNPTTARAEGEPSWCQTGGGTQGDGAASQRCPASGSSGGTGVSRRGFSSSSVVRRRPTQGLPGQHASDSRTASVHSIGAP